MLSRARILEALAQLSEELGRTGVVGELNIVGGTAMVLAFNARTATKDVDAIFEPSSGVRAAAIRVAEKMDLPPDWLNDAAKGFLSESGDFSALESVDLPFLRVQAPTPEYMLAMKIMAARAGIGDEKSDKKDIVFLIRLLNLKDANAAMSVVTRYYDPSRVLPRSAYLLDEIFEEIQS